MKYSIHCLMLCLLGFAACKTDTDKAHNQSPTSTQKTTAVAKETQVITTENGTFELYKAKYRPYTIHVPQNWEIKEHYKSGGFRIKRPYNDQRPDEYFEYVVITPQGAGASYNKATGKMEPKTLDFAKVVAAQIQAMNTKLDKLKIFTQGKTQVAGKEGYVIDYEYILHEPDFVGRVHAITYITEFNNQAYTLTLLDETAEFERSKAILKDIVASWAFVEQ